MSSVINSEKPEADQPPPSLLYKYLSSERVANVLEQRVVRFTPLMNTNDPFEIRKTFRKLVGPKFEGMIFESIESIVSDKLVEELIAKELSNRGFYGVDLNQVRKILDEKYGGDVILLFQKIVKEIAQSMFIPMLNEMDMKKSLVESSAQRLLCFSLSERPDSAPMWAHYADNHKGFVVAFRSDDPFFRFRKNGKPWKFRKVKYFDGKIDELLTDLSAALISKMSSWSYEREWRLYSEKNEVDRIASYKDESIHLLNFPISAVERIIIGSSASRSTVEKVRNAVRDNLFNIRIFRARISRSEQAYVEEPI